MNRRRFLQTTLSGLCLLTISSFVKVGKVLAEEIKKVVMSDEEWKQKLTPEQYNVLRHEGTERPFSSPLNEEKHEGTFVCAGCGLELFPSTYKFNSGTGWPSFY